MIIEPRIRGFICTTAHPAGCAMHVHQEVAYTRSKGPIEGAPKRVRVCTQCLKSNRVTKAPRAVAARS